LLDRAAEYTENLPILAASDDMLTTFRAKPPSKQRKNAKKKNKQILIFAHSIATFVSLRDIDLDALSSSC
jgi:hypothetical protein